MDTRGKNIEQVQAIYRSYGDRVTWSVFGDNHLEMHKIIKSFRFSSQIFNSVRLIGRFIDIVQGVILITFIKLCVLAL